MIRQFSLIAGFLLFATGCSLPLEKAAKQFADGMHRAAKELNTDVFGVRTLQKENRELALQLERIERMYTSEYSPAPTGDINLAREQPFLRVVALEGFFDIEVDLLRKDGKRTSLGTHAIREFTEVMPFRNDVAMARWNARKDDQEFINHVADIDKSYQGEHVQWFERWTAQQRKTAQFEYDLSRSLADAKGVASDQTIEMRIKPGGDTNRRHALQIQLYARTPAGVTKSIYGATLDTESATEGKITVGASKTIQVPFRISQPAQ